tara:strand:- start:587 stop:994 length:408 start_codon:yes stop_codon:yes gene_type:complete
MQFIPHKGPRFYVQVHPQIYRSKTPLTLEEYSELWERVESELITEKTKRDVSGKKTRAYVAIQQYAAAKLQFRSKDSDARAEKGEFERNYSSRTVAQNAQIKFIQKLEKLQKTDPLLHLAYVSTGEHGCRVYLDL